MPRPGSNRLARPAEGSLTLARVTRWTSTVDRRRVVAVMLALIVGATVASALGRASETVEALGSTQPVLVATHRIEPGEPLTAANSVIAPRPTGHVPDGALNERPLDASAAATIVAGEIIVDGRVVGADPAAALSEDERAVTIPMPVAPPPVRVGSVVEIVAVSAGESPFGSSATSLGSGRVIVVGDTAVTIATSEGRAMAVIAQLGSGAIELLITPLEAATGSLGG